LNYKIFILLLRASSLISQSFQGQSCVSNLLLRLFPGYSCILDLCKSHPRSEYMSLSRIKSEQVYLLRRYKEALELLITISIVMCPTNLYCLI
jgi:hypothetical protein